VVLDAQSSASARQSTAQVRLAGAAPLSGTGRLDIEFRPDAPHPDDPAIQFVGNSSREIAFQVKEGATEATFNVLSEIRFQTGTTAGVIVFTARLGGHVEQTFLRILPAAAGIDVTRAARKDANLEVEVSGFDNTRSVSQLGFQFFDPSGRPVSPGVLRVDAASDFQRYFNGSALGGIFMLKAIFPVTGGPAGVAAMEVEIVNQAGVSRSQRIQF